MEKILFIAELSSSINDIFNNLQKSYSTKLVPFDFSFLKKYLYAEHPQLIIAYITNLSYSEDHSFRLFLEYAKNIPLIIIGPKETCNDFLKTSASIKRFIMTPLSVREITEQIMETIKHLDGFELPEHPEMSFSQFTDERKTILVVDDDPVMIRTIMNWLKETYKIAVAKSGTEALTYLENNIPDLILLDYEMPVLNGVQTLELIRKEDTLKDVPVFFLTGVSNPEQVKTAIKLKPEGYILKSSDQKTITEKIALYFAKTNLGKGNLR